VSEARDAHTSDPGQRPPAVYDGRKYLGHVVDHGEAGVEAFTADDRSAGVFKNDRRANWKHGHFSREAKAERSRLRAAILVLRDLRDSI
jgi:hypothetical protein